MGHHYPFELQEGFVCAEDFPQFQNLFAATILQLIPFAYGPVTFLSPGNDAGEYISSKNNPKYWLQYSRKVLKRQRPVLASEKPVLFLPIWGGETISGVAAIEGVDEQFIETLSEEWLIDRSRIISHEFFLLKQLACEPVTGMFNDRHLREILDKTLSDIRDDYALNIAQTTPSRPSPGKTSLLLMEIHPRANSAEKALNYILRAGYYLESFVGQHVLHHLGNGVFGLMGQYMEETHAQQLGKNILNWFRREGFSRVHIGINTIPGTVGTISPGPIAVPDTATVLDQAWIALRKACRRGPFALCTYSSISSPEIHPLRRARPAVMAGLRKLWANCERFAILLISQDRELPERIFPRRILALLEHQVETVINNQSEIFVFIANATDSEALSWAQGFRKKLPDDLETTYSIGIASFPCIDFNKSDIPQNARKALLHAGFYGPDTVTVFDAISQNVSGDIYYSDGDIIRALKEYRKGLDMDPTNTNLLNSIGEAYAQMNKARKSRAYFDAVLRLDSRHYMALFNLGITYLTTGEYPQSIEYFEKALTFSKHSLEVNQRYDLVLQLGKLYCRTGRYTKAVRLLENERGPDKKEGITSGRNAILRYLGEAYMATGKTKKAIIALQQAISHNPHDAYALSLLGELYARENQGDDIALSLCMQAIDIDDRHWQHWYRVAWLRYKMAQYGAALDAVKECLRRNKKDADASFLAGKIYLQLNAKAKAAGMFQATLRINPKYRSAALELKKINIK